MGLGNSFCVVLFFAFLFMLHVIIINKILPYLIYVPYFDTDQLKYALQDLFTKKKLEFAVT